MTLLDNIDLRHDAAAALYVKEETVQVEFAAEPGELVSREGPNRYRVGDAIVTGSTGDRWCVSRDRFDARYDALAEAGAYRNKPVPVLAKEMTKPFSIARSAGGDVLHGKAGDWLMQYAPGDYGITERARFLAVYRLA
ncbi:PGDYG domain-containing protein [Cupriavidus plantarum]|uniref:PGDYG protein n=1 Tax=Cupriavidus plantarum TaxID=942865 RepID=A0A316F5J4_9BURK|nr:PGDYG domain-containing protein [Cupriavidus plantarum]PWK38749.1 PGDYG protein [Cupriavidus plantarum]